MSWDPTKQAEEKRPELRRVGDFTPARLGEQGGGVFSRPSQSDGESRYEN